MSLRIYRVYKYNNLVFSVKAEVVEAHHQIKRVAQELKRYNFISKV